MEQNYHDAGQISEVVDLNLLSMSEFLSALFYLQIW